MKFRATPLAGVWLVELEQRADERGFFARSFCREEFLQQGLEPAVVQCNVSFNHKRGTLRGLHFQVAPHAEAKLIRVTRGAAFDVAVDLRRDSATYGQWYAAELTADNYRALYLPQGCAHGFQTLADNTEMFYQMAEFYHPESAQGVRWDDRQLQIHWPLAEQVVSERDQALPTLADWEAACC